MESDETRCASQAASQAAQAQDAQARMVAAGQSDNADAAAATAAVLRQRAEAAHRRATAAEAQADLAHDRAAAADAAAQRAMAEQGLHTAALNMANALFQMQNTAQQAHISLQTKQDETRNAKQSALAAARSLQEVQAQSDEISAALAPAPKLSEAALKQQVCLLLKACGILGLI